MVTYFPLHNEYDLKGFDWRREKEGASAGLNRKERAEKAGLSKIQTLFKEMLGEAYNFVEEKWVDLSTEWSFKCSRFWRHFIPPVTSIRNYFGEKIAFYFDFLGLYSRYICIAIPFGIALFVLFILFDSSSTVNKVMYCVYAVVTVLWTTVFLEHMKWKSNGLAIEWG